MKAGAGSILEKGKKTIFQEAERLVNGPRQKMYGHPKVNLNKIARMWSAYLGVIVTERDVCWMMALLKGARAAATHHRDALVDAVGYLRLIEMLED